jgi:tellurium resistance protein TerZ
MGGDDGLDNEIITVDFARLNPSVSSVAFVLNSFQDTILEQFHLH